MKKYQQTIEIILAILLILFVAGYLIPNFNKIKDMGKNGKAKDGLHTIQLAIEKYAVDTEGEYPPYLIGGDLIYASSIDFDAREDAITGLTLHTDLTTLSDPLLRLGYLESYPRNPFVGKKDAVDIAKLQDDVEDPLRNGASGPTLGCRFGGDCMKMGNVSADYRLPYFKYKDRKGVEKELATHADFEGYPYYDVWESRKPKFYLPGEFFYKSMGPIIAVNANGLGARNPIQPVEIDQYIMGVYGGLHTRGFDVLGPEPLLHGFTSGNGVVDMPTVPVSGVLLTRWTNIPDKNGRFQGSPYGENTENLITQFTIGNPNGIKDGIILILTSGDEQDVTYEK